MDREYILKHLVNNIDNSISLFQKLPVKIYCDIK